MLNYIQLCSMVRTLCVSMVSHNIPTFTQSRFVTPKPIWQPRKIFEWFFNVARCKNEQVSSFDNGEEMSEGVHGNALEKIKNKA